jgi:hypothetical protein
LNIVKVSEAMGATPWAADLFLVVGNYSCILFQEYGISCKLVFLHRTWYGVFCLSLVKNVILEATDSRAILTCKHGSLS